MPQASAKLQDWATNKFGSLDDGPVVAWLEEQGYKEVQNGWLAFKPGISTLQEMTDDELLALHFLIEEWDFGGIGTVEK